VRTYSISIEGTQPLLMHNDDIRWADQMDAWKNDKNNKKGSKAGDDRSPAWRWLGSLYRDEKNTVIIPAENVMRCLMEAGAMVPVPGAKGNKTFKSQTQSGIIPMGIGWPLLINGKPIPSTPLNALLKQNDFDEHELAVEELGFALFVKRAKIGQSKHIRVRPRFDQWAAVIQLAVTDDQITTDALADIIEMAGKYKGLGDWRPGGKTPGTFGMFRATLKLN